MSLILDALRKSEAERQRGQAPSVFTATPGAPRSLRWSLPGWPLSLIGLLLLAAAWWVWHGDRREDVAIAASQTQSSTSARSSPSAVDDVAPTPAPARPSSTVAEAPAASAKPPSKPTAPARTPPVAPAPAQAVIIPPTPLPAPPAEPAASVETLPTLAVLDADTRASLPPLKLSMHVWSQEPARRFAIVDGQRVSEGALLGAGRVAEIRRDGLVLEVNGRRLLLAKP